MSSIRSFIALPTSDSVKDGIIKIQEELKQLGTDVKWDSPDKFHITLKFLGNVELQVLEKLTTELEAFFPKFVAFDFTYQGVGAFPDFNRPRIVWVGTSLSDKLSSVQQHIEEICTRLGFKKEDRAFHPHITLGRVKGTRNIHRLTEKLKNITFDPTNSRCTELLVMRSDLHPSGSVYSVLKSIPLKP